MIDFVPFLLFVIFMVGTPGPANMLLMTSGANFGFWHSLPFVGGVTLGKLLLNILLALGLWEVLSHDPRVLLALKVVCVAYLAWLALRMSGFLMSGQELPAGVILERTGGASVESQGMGHAGFRLRAVYR